ncbi:hypothetical protein LSCM1_04002 [Leishmania martiniquensis]|uniref:Uncharacterized protein n=1 Tax=Leishmania martiniquensis TaxID=1580590 RepID=A0A836KJ96_9TRYP|nr:hypothetical protein LSCM1_04002 [Leishmania martiniquensis]
MSYLFTSRKKKRPTARNSCINPNTAAIHLLGICSVKLLRYRDLPEDARLRRNLLYYVYPATWVRTLNPRTVIGQHVLKTIKSEKLQPGVRWKSQFGKQLIYFYGYHGLPYISGFFVTDEEISQKLVDEYLNGPKRSSFVSATFPDIDIVKSFFLRKLRTVSTEVIHLIRLSYKQGSRGDTIMYERSAPTLEGVLDEKPFEAQGYYDEKRISTDVFVLPQVDGVDKADYTLFRLQVSGKTMMAFGRRETLQVRYEDGEVVVTSPNRKLSDMYVRLEERHILKLAGTEAELHIVKVQEKGPHVVQRANAVRVELRQPPLPSSQPIERNVSLWAIFLALSKQIAAHLSILASDERETTAEKVSK